MNEDESGINTEAQRRALDLMSAHLLDKLNSMIAEQEARVQEFSLQQNSLTSLPMQERQPDTKRIVQQAPQVPEPISEGPAAPLQPPPRSVTPPPVAPKKMPRPTMQTPPPVPHRTAPATGKEGVRRNHRAAGGKVPHRTAPATGKEEGNESSIGCGTIVIVFMVIGMLVRACS